MQRHVSAPISWGSQEEMWSFVTFFSICVHWNVRCLLVGVCEYRVIIYTEVVASKPQSLSSESKSVNTWTPDWYLQSSDRLSSLGPRPLKTTGVWMRPTELAGVKSGKCQTDTFFVPGSDCWGLFFTSEVRAVHRPACRSSLWIWCQLGFVWSLFNWLIWWDSNTQTHTQIRGLWSMFLPRWHGEGIRNRENFYWLVKNAAHYFKKYISDPTGTKYFFTELC